MQDQEEISYQQHSTILRSEELRGLVTKRTQIAAMRRSDCDADRFSAEDLPLLLCEVEADGSCASLVEILFISVVFLRFFKHCT